MCDIAFVQKLRIIEFQMISFFQWRMHGLLRKLPKNAFIIIEATFKVSASTDTESTIFISDKLHSEMHQYFSGALELEVVFRPSKFLNKRFGIF